MQTKMIFFFVFLLLSGTCFSQETIYSATVNNGRVFEKGNSFTLTVIPDKSSASLGLYVYNPEKKSIELQISHKVNGIVVDTIITSGQFNRRYNFEQADDGLYQITLACEKEKISKKVEINTITTRNVVIE